MMSVDDYFDADSFHSILVERFPTNILPHGTVLTKRRKYTLAMGNYYQFFVRPSANHAGAEWGSYIEAETSGVRSRYSRDAVRAMVTEEINAGKKVGKLGRPWRKKQLQAIDKIFGAFFKDQLDENGLLELQDIYSVYLELCCWKTDEMEDKVIQLRSALTMILLSGGIVAGLRPNSPDGVWPDGNLVVYWPHKQKPEFGPITKF